MATEPAPPAPPAPLHDLQLWIDAGSECSGPALAHSWDRSGTRRRSKNLAEEEPTAVPCSEATLVKDSLHALQGLPAAITRLQALSTALSLQAADKSVHNISTLWTTSASTNALAKLLSQLALAGSYRYQLDQFVQNFLGVQHVGAVKPEIGATSNRTRRKRRARKNATEASLQEPANLSHGLLNQAFAAAVRTILQGHSASLNSLLGSTYRRSKSKPVSDEHGGVLFGFGHGFISLLELYLHTEELRVQLQALVRICLLSAEGNASPSSGNMLADGTSKFHAFPRGANLLTHLYNLLREPDPVHLELLRFLFARTFEPYASFVRSCIYSATLKDPYGEFILEQTSSLQWPQPAQNLQGSHHLLRSSLQVRSGASTPVFLVQVCTQLLRAGQQLEVLLKLPEAHEFAQVLALDLNKEEDTDLGIHNALALAFDKKGLAHISKQRNSRLASVADHIRKFFGDLYPTSLIERLVTSESHLEADSAEATLRRPEETDFPKCNVPDLDGSDIDTCTSESCSSITAEQVEMNKIIDVVTDDSALDSAAQSPQQPSTMDWFIEGPEELHDMNLFLSGYNRGASWLDVGLPKNPFFASNNMTVYGYFSTLFLDTDIGWDIRSDLLNEDSLLKKLVPELAQVGLLSATKVSNLKKSADMDAVNVLLGGCNLPAQNSVESRADENLNQAGSKTKPEGGFENNPVQQVEQQNKVSARGGASWETAMRMVQRQNDQSRSFDEEQTDSDLPISVVVEKGIVEEILMQYRLISFFTVRLLQDNLRLQEHYMALRRYYFMEVGDWADNFVTALCSHNWGLTRGQHLQVEVQGMLESALQKSSCDGDPYADRLHIYDCPRNENATRSEFVNPSSLEAFDFIELGYHVDWPLDLILTSDAFSLYRTIFRVLLRVRHAVYALGEISNSLQVMERSLRKLRSNPEQQNRFRALQLFRHHIGHFVTTVQCHIQSQLLYVIWSEFFYAIQHEIKDMQDLEIVHFKYLTRAVQQCFLSPELAGVKACMDSIMQCLLDFRSALKNISSPEDGDICSDHLYSRVLELRSLFRDRICKLHDFHLKSGLLYQLSDFWTALDYNGYFASNR